MANYVIARQAILKYVKYKPSNFGFLFEKNEQKAFFFFFSVTNSFLFRFTIRNIH